MGLQNEGVEFGIAAASVFILTFVIEYIRYVRSKNDKPRDLREQCANTASCFIFLLLTAAAYIRRPDDAHNDPSILLTAGAGLQLYALCLLYLFPQAVATGRRAPAVFGLLMAYALFARTWCTMKYNGYLPADETGDGCIQILEACAGLLAIWGLYREGGVPQAARGTLAALAAAWAAALVCYGQLDHRPWVDRYYASSLYAELLAWVYMLRASDALTRAGRAVDGIYLLPSFVQAVCRSYAWYTAYEVMELLPRNSQPMIRGMAWFPLVTVLVHFAMSVVIAGMGALCLKEVHVVPDLAESIV